MLGRRLWLKLGGNIMNQEFKQKWLVNLSSKRFWMAITALVVCICSLIGTDSNTTEKVVSLVGAVSTVIIYLLVQEPQ